MTIDKKALGQAIKQLRKARGMTQVALASASGLAGSGNTLALIERGERGVSMDTLNSLADALDVDAACLTVLGSKSTGKTRVTSDLIASLQKLIIATVMAHERTHALPNSIPFVSGSVRKPKSRRSASEPIVHAESLEIRELKTAMFAVAGFAAPSVTNNISDVARIGYDDKLTALEHKQNRYPHCGLSTKFRIEGGSDSSDRAVAEYATVDDVMTKWHCTEWWESSQKDQSANTAGARSLSVVVGSAMVGLVTSLTIAQAIHE